MADEITLNMFISATKGYQQVSRAPETITIDWDNGQLLTTTQSIGSSFEPLKKADDMATLGLCWIRNVGANVASISFDGGVTTTHSLLAGEYSTWRFAESYDIADCQVKADTSTEIEYLVFSK